MANGRKRGVCGVGRWMIDFCLLGTASLFLGLGTTRVSAAEITMTNANNGPIAPANNNNAWSSTNGPTNTMIWTNTTTGWINYFQTAPYFNGLRWDSSSTNGLGIGGTAVNVGFLAGTNPFIDVTSSDGLVKLSGGILGGSNGLTKKGPGKLDLSSKQSTFTGGLTIEAGRVMFNASNNVLTSNNLNLQGGELLINVTNFMNLTFADVTWGNGKMVGGGGTGSLTANSYTLTNTANITNGYVLAGAGGLNKSSGEGNFILNAANTFGGVGVTNIVSAGTLTLGNASALGNTSNSFELRTGGTLNVSNISPTFSTFTFAGGNLSGGTTNILTADSGFVVTGGTLTISNRLAGSGGFTQNGSGTTTLSRTNSYVGATTVSQGTLLVDTTGSIASSSAVVNSGLLNVNGVAGGVTVNSGGSLGGSGRVGAVTLTSGSFLKPGNSPGLLTASEASWAAGSTYNWEINNATGVAGTNWDVFSVTGALDLSALSSGQMNLVLQSLSIANYSTSTSYSWVIAKATSFTGIAGGVQDLTNLFNINADAFNGGSVGNLPNGGFQVVTGTDGGLRTLNLMAIPEPSAFSLMGIGLASLILLRSFRRFDV